MLQITGEAEVFGLDRSATGREEQEEGGKHGAGESEDGQGLTSL